MATPSEVLPLSSVEHVSKEWLTNVLRCKMNTPIPITIESIETKIPQSKAGFLSDICFIRVLLTGSDSSTSVMNLVVKTLPRHEKIVEFMKIGRLGEREAAFYNFAGSSEFLDFCRLSGLDHPAPEVYYSCINGDVLTLVLSDLNAKGYEMRLLPEGNDVQQIKCTLEAIAVIHAYGYAAIKKHGKEYFHVPFDSSYLDDIVCQGLQMQIKMLSEDPLAETYAALVPLHKQLIATSSSNPLIETLVHGDLWAGNVMFAADDKTASILDWQFYSVDNPLCDVTSMLLMSAVPSVYEEHLEEVLQSYWKSFTNALTKNNADTPIQFEDVVNNLKKLWMHGFMFFSASLPDMLGNGKITEERILKVISFLNGMGVLSDFVDKHKLS